MQKLLSLALILLIASSSLAQQAALSKNAASVKRKVSTLSPHAPVSVVPIHAHEEFGEFISSGDETFTFYDVDRKSDVTLRFDEVRKIKDGYGGYNSVQRRHTDHTKGLVITLVVIGGLGVLIAAAATAR
jgi:hypothetical protein